MAYVQIPKDLSKIKEKVIFNLTKRQLICFGIGIAIALPTYFLLKDVVSKNAAVMCMFVILLPSFFMGIYEKNGMTIEKIIFNKIQRNIRPKVRTYKSQNIYYAISEQIKLDEEVARLERYKKNK